MATENALFNVDDTNIFLQSQPNDVTLLPPRASLQVIALSDEPREILWSYIFRSGASSLHTEQQAISLLRENPMTGLKKLVFIQNYGPCCDCADVLNIFHQTHPNISIFYLFAVPYKDCGHNHLDSDNIGKQMFGSWRWVPFLLWNQGYLGNHGRVVEWWEKSYHDCKEAIQEGLRHCGIELLNARDDMKKLLIHSGCPATGRINVFNYLTRKEFTLDDFIDSLDVWYPDERNM